MKTLTELSGTLVRMAAAAIAEARRTLPAPEAPAAAEPAPVAAALAEQPPSEQAPGEAAAVAPPPGGESAAAVAAEPPPAPAPAPAPKRDEEAESDAVKAALDDAVAKATGLSGDRLARLREAVKAAGSRVRDVRLVRVFGPEEPVQGAKTLGGFQYLVDLAPASMKQEVGDPRKERGRGGRGRGGGGGGGGGRGGGAKGATTGGFSMDSLREDRKNARGGRGRPGGGGGRGR